MFLAARAEILEGMISSTVLHGSNTLMLNTKEKKSKGFEMKRILGVIPMDKINKNSDKIKRVDAGKVC